MQFENLITDAYPATKLRLQWAENPLEMREDLVIPQFDLESVKFEARTRLGTLGNFSQLIVNFSIVRDSGFYLLQIYLPSLFVVLTAFTAFWIDPCAVPGRVTVSVFTTLLMGNMSFGLREIVPRVSYIKAVDVWVLACTVFVFFALIEYAIVNILLRQKQIGSTIGTMIRKSTQAVIVTSRVGKPRRTVLDEYENIKFEVEDSMSSGFASPLPDKVRMFSIAFFFFFHCFHT